MIVKQTKPALSPTGAHGVQQTANLMIIYQPKMGAPPPAAAAAAAAACTSTVQPLRTKPTSTAQVGNDNSKMDMLCRLPKCCITFVHQVKDQVNQEEASKTAYEPQEKTRKAGQ
jgi:hypothetical protein